MSLLTTGTSETYVSTPKVNYRNIIYVNKLTFKQDELRTHMYLKQQVESPIFQFNLIQLT